MRCVSRLLAVNRLLIEYRKLIGATGWLVFR